MRLPWNKSQRDAATLQVGALLNAGGNFVSAVGLAHLLGASEQGRFYVALALYAFLFLAFNLGVFNATVSQVAAANARDQHDKVAAWIAFLAKAYLSLGLGLCVVGTLVFWIFAGRGLLSDLEVARWAWWLTLTPLLDLPRVVLGAAMQGTRTMLPLAQSENTTELLRVFLVLTGAVVTHSMAGPIVGTLLATGLGSLVTIEIYRHANREPGTRLPGLRRVWAHRRAVPIKQGLPLGMKLGFLRTSDALALEVLPSLLFQHFASNEWVAYLRIAQRLMGIPVLFMQGISRTMMPKLSEFAGLKDMERFRASFLRTTRISACVITLGLVAMWIAIPWILERFFPSSYSAPVRLLSTILLPGFVLLSLSVSNDGFYFVTNTLRVGMILCGLGLLVSLASIPLAHLYPTTGIAWGLSLTRAWTATNFLYALWYFRRSHAAPAT